MAKYKRSGYFAFDTETGGLNPKENSLLTLAGTVVDDDLLPLVAKPINLKIKHDTYYTTPRAMEINKINLDEHSKEALSIKDAGNELYQYLMPFITNGRLGVIGQNVEFDKGFVLESGLLRSWDRFFNREVLDTKIIADHLKNCKLLPENLSTSLVALAEYFEIATDNAHDAAHDLQMTLQVLDKLKIITREGKREKNELFNKYVE